MIFIKNVTNCTTKSLKKKYFEVYNTNNINKGSLYLKSI